jgi:hypothetical protein
MQERTGEGPWRHEEPLGFGIGRSTSVVRLSSGGLFVHSPGEL